MYEDNSFITLTFNDEFLPQDQSLDIVVFQKFMKRLRKYLSSKKYDDLARLNGWSTSPKIRFYACGEYGENFGRPHYHACIFGFSFPDKVIWKKSNDNPLYRSPILEKVWPFGYCSVGDLTFESAAYTARYILKKVNGDLANDHYEQFNPETGEITQRKPEYTNMSKGGRTGKGGIGSSWLAKFLSDVYPEDFVIINNKKMKPPKFYDAKYELMTPLEYQKMKRKRKKAGLEHEMDNTPARLKVRETVQLSKLKHLPRNLK